MVNPLPYISACQYDACQSQRDHTCHAMEAYARECAKFGICLEWRSHELCPVACGGGAEYRQCGAGCVNNCKMYLDAETDHDDTCLMSVTDGCYCPQGQAFNDALGRCVAIDHCAPCDSDGHYRGSLNALLHHGSMRNRVLMVTHTFVWSAF